MELRAAAYSPGRAHCSNILMLIGITKNSVSLNLIECAIYFVNIKNPNVLFILLTVKNHQNLKPSEPFSDPPLSTGIHSGEPPKLSQFDPVKDDAMIMMKSPSFQVLLSGSNTNMAT